jgi:arylsulfatase A-like enzyme
VLLIVCACSMHVWAVGEIAANRQTRPNVVFVLVDTLRGDMLFGDRGGVPIMPRLAELSKEGHVFLAASSPCSWTRPAMASIFTGQHVNVHRVYFGAAPDGSETSYAHVLSAAWVTLAEAMQDAGYRNHALVTNPNVAPGSGMEQGFALENYHYELDAPAARVTEFALDRASGALLPVSALHGPACTL